MTTDPRDAEISRLRAERDAALAQVAGAFEAAAQTLTDALKDAGGHPTAMAMRRVYADLSDQIRALTPADALAERDRRDAQMRAEGMREAAEAFHAEIRKGSLALEAEGYAVFADRFVQASALVRDDILAVAEKEGKR